MRGEGLNEQGPLCDEAMALTTTVLVRSIALTISPALEVIHYPSWSLLHSSINQTVENPARHHDVRAAMYIKSPASGQREASNPPLDVSWGRR